MATKEIKDVCRVELPIEAANMLEAKRMLDESYNELCRVMDKFSKSDIKNEEKAANAYCLLNELILDMASVSINEHSLSNYRVVI